MNDAGANNKNGLLEKGRSGVLHVIFGRSAVVLVLILIQLILMFWVFRWFSSPAQSASNHHSWYQQQQ